MADPFLPAFKANEEAAISPQFFMHEGVECVRVLKAGDSRSIPVFRAEDEFARGEYGETLTYAERWPDQYEQFKQGATQTANGTPLDRAPFLNPSRIADLRALKVFSIEGLAQFPDNHISRLGGNGYKLKELAQEFLLARTMPMPALTEEVEAMRAELAALRAASQVEAHAQPEPYTHLEDDEIRERIKSLNNGKYPVGRPSREVLVGMLRELEVDTKAA